MDVKALIKDNNGRRKSLTKENLAYYEDMLIYIRLSYEKSERETEEILSELLDHLLQAQKNGKTAQNVFGNRPKQFADSIVGELPKRLTKEAVKFFTMIILYFLAAVMVANSVLHLILYYGFQSGKLFQEYYIGTVAVETIIFTFIAFLALFGIILQIRHECFKEKKKIVEFIKVWLVSTLVFILFLLIYHLMPEFGYKMTISLYVLFAIGAVLYMAGRFIRLKI